MKISRAIIWCMLAVFLQACASTSNQTSTRDRSLRVPPKPTLSSDPTTQRDIVADAGTSKAAVSPAEEPAKPKLTPPRPVAEGPHGLLTPASQQRPQRSLWTDKEKQKVVLNFEKADIAEVTNQIFGDYLKLNYVADPSLQGRISVFLEGEYSKDELFQMVVKVYEANNISIVPRNGIYFIQPVQRSSSSSLSIADGMILKDDETGAKPVIVIFRTRYMDAAKALNIVKPFLSPGRPSAADTLTNSIIFVENTDNARSIINVIKALDIDVFAELNMEIVTVQSITPQDAAQGMESLVGKLAVFKESNLKNNLAFIPLPNFGGVLILAQSREVLKEAKSWLTALDMQGKEAGEQIYVFFVQNALARDIAEILTQVYGLQGGAVGGRAEQKVVGSLRGTGTSSSAFGRSSSFGSGSSSSSSRFSSSSSGLSSGSSLSSSLSGDSSSSLGRSTGLSGSGLSSSSSGLTTFGGTASQRRQTGTGLGTGRTSTATSLTGEVVVIADEVNNALVIRANAADYARIRKTVETLDVIPRAVLIEVTLAEIALVEKLQYGLEWFFKDIGMKVGDRYGTLGGLQQGIEFTDITKPSELGTAGLYLSWLSSDQNILVFLQALSEETDVEVLATPTLLATDNKEASIMVGGREPVPTGSYTGGTSDVTGVLSTISYEETGIILNVIPHVNAGGLVRMDVDQTIRRKGGETTVGNNSKAPTFDERNVKTSMLAQSGSTVVIGGIIRHDLDEGFGGIPILKNIPVIGPLFTSRKKTETKKTELIIAITPHVIETRESEATREFLDKLKSLKGKIKQYPVESR